MSDGVTAIQYIPSVVYEDHGLVSRNLTRTRTFRYQAPRSRLVTPFLIYLSGNASGLTSLVQGPQGLHKDNKAWRPSKGC